MIPLADMEHLYRVLVALNKHRVRATYGALGEYLAHVHTGQIATTIARVPPVNQSHVGQPAGQMLGAMKPGWHTSWIVNRATREPSPYVYDDSNTHPDLKRSDWLITTGGELALLCEL